MNKLRLVGISLIVIISLVFLSAIEPTQPNLDKLKTQPLVDTTVDITCVENCTIPPPDFDLLYSVSATKLPDSNNSVIVNALDNINVKNTVRVVIQRTIGNDTKDISNLELEKTLTFSFITTDSSFDDLTSKSLSYSFIIDMDKKLSLGSFLLEIYGNDQLINSKKYSIPLNPVDGKIIVNTDKLLIGDLIKNIPDGKVDIKLIVKEFYVRNDVGLYSLLTTSSLHAVSVDKDSNRVIYKNESGQSVKIYPTDDKLQIFSSPSDVSYPGGSCVSSTKGSCNRWAYGAPSFTPMPAVGVITIKDSLKNVIFTSNAFPGSSSLVSTCVKTEIWYGQEICVSTGSSPLPIKILDLDIQRDSQYFVTIGSPTNVNFWFHTPKSQANYSFNIDAYGNNFPNN